MRTPLKLTWLAPLVFFISSVAFADGAMELRVHLYPAGSFVAKSSKVTGQAQQINADEFTAKNIKVDTASFDSGIGLRNTHIKKRFEPEKYPYATLLEAHGKGGKGTGKIQVKGVTKDVSGTYKIVDNMIEATFKTKASEFGINDVSYMGVGMEDELEVFTRIPIVKAAGK